MDGQMPVMDGLDATRAIRCHEAATGARRPIVGVTANLLPAYRSQCLAAGMDDVTHKPLAMAALLRLLARWLPGFAPRQAVRAAPVAVVPVQAPAAPVQAPAARGVKTAEGGAIDWSRVDVLRAVEAQGGLRLVDKAIGLYFDHAPRLIEAIRAVRSGDLASVVRAAHSLKSSSASLGANVVSGLSSAIERAAAAGDIERIESVISDLEWEYRRAASELRGAAA